jgi:hypothetical protein
VTEAVRAIRAANAAAAERDQARVDADHARLLEVVAAGRVGAA